MSADATALFMQKYAVAARMVCPDMPEKLHPHMLRHTRAMHLYRSGMPINLLSETLGHANTETTQIYAYSDSEMKRAAMERSDALRDGKPPPIAMWDDDEDLILELSGLK